MAQMALLDILAMLVMFNTDAPRIPFTFLKVAKAAKGAKMVGGVLKMATFPTRREGVGS